MEGSRISILEKFGVSSVIMSYYGPSHKSFLLLSRLSRKSRFMLDEFYDAVLNSFLESATVLTITEENSKMMFLPSDLFRFVIYLEGEKMVEVFLKFIDNRQARKGYYFNTHFMHKRLCIWRIYVDPEIVECLLSYVDTFKSIKILSDNYSKSNELDEKNSTMMGRISLKDKTCFRKDHSNVILPHSSALDNESEKNIIFLNNFKRIYFIYLMFDPFEESMSVINQINKWKLQIDFIHLRGTNPEEWEKLTDSENFKNGLYSLNYCFNEYHALTDKVFENILKIKCKSVCFELKYGLTANYDYIRILK